MHAERERPSPALDFLWLELTNRCNLRCVHCYAESGPDAEVEQPLSTVEYEQLLEQARASGCTKVQFIGGEPALRPDLPMLIARARELGYAFVEVYTNLTRLPDALLACFATNGVHVATSVYAPTAEVHDRITRVAGSFTRTTANIRRLTAAGIAVRASIVEMDENAGLTEATTRFLTDALGVRHVKVDRRRPFGRGADGEASMHDLCGACAEGTLCVAPDGRVSPCIMSKQWPVGSVRDERLGDIVLSERLTAIRASFRSAVGPVSRDASCDPDTIGCPPLNRCGPEINPSSVTCMPLAPCGPQRDSVARDSFASCDPSSQCGPVIGCPPLNRCGPEINGVRSAGRE